ncbi:MAG: hypothetical protein QJT81_00135 [Candidatus Thiothrix putei]|uniref:Uncharacterized protein n=1 Tax=Candidatus Thiothrix putei TaxID=3080811 RepID=A0AA95HF65_9GAMM|nr:MAG: hypothetical protein QJT81_00135 [Candidatus Thiothrix putei]
MHVLQPNFQAIALGYAVDACSPLLVERYQWGETTPIRNVFEGLEVHVAVRDTDACLYKVGFQVTLVGRIIALHIRAGM